MGLIYFGKKKILQDKETRFVSDIFSVKLLFEIFMQKPWHVGIAILGAHLHISFSFLSADRLLYSQLTQNWLIFDQAYFVIWRRDESLKGHKQLWLLFCFSGCYFFQL